jgi:hypothetical protein
VTLQLSYTSRVDWAIIVAAALSAGAIGNFLYDVLKRWVRARETTSIVIQQGDRTLKLDALNSEDAETIIEAFLSRAQADARAEEPKSQEGEAKPTTGEARPTAREVAREVDE